MPHRSIFMLAVAFLVVLGSKPAPLWADEQSHSGGAWRSRYAADSDHGADDGLSTRDDEPLRWFLLFAGVNAHPKLESEKLLDDLFDPAMRLLAPTFDDVRTIGDLRDDFILWPPHVGVGRILSDRWAVFVQAGYTAGKVRTKDNDTSILLLPLHTDVEIKRGALYAGVGADYFPFGMVELRKYDGVMERLRAARPALGARLTWTRATYRAKVKVGFGPFPNLINLELSDKWLLPSVNTNLGLDVPLNKRSALTFNAGYNFFFDQESDFEGPAFTVGWKRFFRPPGQRSQTPSPASETLARNPKYRFP